MKFIKKKELPKENSQSTEPSKRGPAKYGPEVKRRAYELYMEIDFWNNYTRKHSCNDIAKILKKEFKSDPTILSLTNNTVRFWAIHYEWDTLKEQLLTKARDRADKELKQEELYAQLLTSAKPRMRDTDQINRLIDERAFYAAQLNKFTPTVTALIVDLFRINQEHFTNLMEKDKEGKWEYDCDQYGRRRQLFDMWMEGTAKIMEVYNVIPKRTTTKATMPNGEEIHVDSQMAGGVDLGDPNYELILKLFGVEQTKGGFGHELSGPNNADFPGESGATKPVVTGETGTDKKSKRH